MIYAEILAAGKGTRMGNTDLPKQFHLILEKPIIIHTIEKFLINKNIDKIIICCPNIWMEYTKDLLKNYNIESDKVHVTAGGETRDESIINGCRYIEKTFGINNDDVILTHDAVRPFVSQRIIEENIELAKCNDAVNTAIPATDTIVYSEDSLNVNEIPIRSYYMQGQTPQTFKLKMLIDFYDNMSLDLKKQLTDACKIFTLNNKNVKIVKGEETNIKITTQFDLKVANLLVNGK